MASQDLPEIPHHPTPPNSSKKIRIKTTWPCIPPNVDRAPIRTDRLVLRPWEAGDLDALYQLRTQPEVMLWTAVGTVDTLEKTMTFIKRFLPPNDLETYNWAVEYLGDDTDDDGKQRVLIGAAGVHRTNPESGWPEIGYMFRKEYWGKGFATEFLRAFTKAWWALPRKTVEVEVDEATVSEERRAQGSKDGGDTEAVQVPEVLYAVIVADNAGSRRVLDKTGFREYKRWSEPDSRVGFEGEMKDIVSLLAEMPGNCANTGIILGMQ